MKKTTICQIIGFAYVVVVFVANIINTRASEVLLDEKISQKIAEQLNK